MAQGDLIIGRGVRVEVGKTEGAAKTVTAITTADPGVATSATHGLSTKSVGYFSGVTGMVNLEGQAVRLGTVATDTFVLEDIDTTGYPAFTAGSFVPITAWATLSKATTAYSSSGEVAAGDGYSTGGATLSGFSAALDGDVAVLDFADPTWAEATITARGGLIYNSSQSNKAVAVLDFGEDVTSTAETFKVTMPAATGAAGIIRLQQPVA
jgi:hypothetical protein